MSDVRRDCEVARLSIHRRLDGEAPSDAELRQLDEHLESCEACRESAEELSALQAGLRAIPLRTMPDEALEEVLGRTVRTQRRRPPAARRGFDWRLAAAAVVTVGVIGLWQTFYPPVPGPAEPGEAQLAQAASEARMVLGLTAEALRRANRTAKEEVLADEVSGALRRVPIRWPSSDTRTGGGRPSL